MPKPVVTMARQHVALRRPAVTATLAVTLVAAKLRIPVAHLESGLRSFDRTMPEEINRIVADEFSELLFVHSDEGIANLRREGIEDQRIHFVGNTMIDSLVAMERRFRGAGTAARLGVRAGDYLLVTLHRPALVDGPLLGEVMDRLAALARELPVVFPLHPRTRKMLAGAELGTGVILTDPVGYLDFLSLESDAAGVLTDSGGVQEETTYLRVPCFTLRDSTERPVTIRAGTNTLLGLEPERIDDILPALRSFDPARAAEPPPLWDGNASARVTDVIERAAAAAAAEPAR
jgi:UDP-N-acetylglucosamine 2-epimerase (non-hydrolysing)